VFNGWLVAPFAGETTAGAPGGRLGALVVYDHVGPVVALPLASRATTRQRYVVEND
jgi:hypothetical protein